jgi:hypothetical protein
MVTQTETTKVNHLNGLEKALTDRRHQILQLLAQYRFLTTNQIHSLLQPERPVKKTWKELDRLRKLGMIKSVSYESEKGIYGELCWLLLLRGAKVIDFRGFGRNNLRKPSPEKVVYRTLELILEWQVQHAGSNSFANWSLEKPQNLRTSNSQQHTSQYYRLIEAINWKIYRQTGHKPENPEGFQTLCVPTKANDFVAFSASDNRLAVVLILPPVHASEKFWLSRIEQYQELAKELPVFGVFEDDKEALIYKPLLNPHGLRVTTLNRISVLLEAIASHSKI